MTNFGGVQVSPSGGGGGGSGIELSSPSLSPDWSLLPEHVDPTPDEETLVTGTVTGSGGASVALQTSASDNFLFQYGSTVDNAPIPEWETFSSAYGVISPANLGRNVGGVTVAGVFRPVKTSSSTIFWMSTPLSGNPRCAIEYNNNGAVTMSGRRLDGDTTESVVSATGVMDLDRFSRVVAVWDFTNRTMSLVINGTEVASGATLWGGGGNTSDTDSADIFLGVKPSGPRFVHRFRGLWGWKSAETAADIDTELQKITP